MGILSDFFIADGSIVPDYQGGEAVDRSDKYQLKGITPLQAAQLLAVLRGQEYVVGMVREFKLVSPEEAEEWTMSVPQDMVHALAQIQGDQTAEIAAQFARATSEELEWSPNDFEPIVRELAALARRAMETGKSMYLWNSL